MPEDLNSDQPDVFAVQRALIERVQRMQMTPEQVRWFVGYLVTSYATTDVVSAALDHVEKHQTAPRCPVCGSFSRAGRSAVGDSWCTDGWHDGDQRPEPVLHRPGGAS